jgi:transketolase
MCRQLLQNQSILHPILWGNTSAELCVTPSLVCATTCSEGQIMESLYRLNFAAKNLLLNLHYRAKSGHVGSSLSCIEILSFIRFHCWSADSKLVVSKGHAASALYSVLATAGDIREHALTEGYYRDGSLFSAHPPPNKLPNIPFATGSLGHGPGICNGLALGARLRAKNGAAPATVFCVLSDGELNEGSVWEAFAFAAHHNLDNLVFFIDRNRLQGFGSTEEVFDMEPLRDKLTSFGMNVVHADGHNFHSLMEAYETLGTCHHSPLIVVAETLKGRGLPGLAGTVDSHYLPMTPEMFEGVLDFCEQELKTNLSKITQQEELTAPCELNLPEQSSN